MSLREQSEHVVLRQVYDGAVAYEGWRQDLTHGCGAFDVSCCEPKRFAGIIDVRRVAGFDLARVSANIDRIARTRRQNLVSNDQNLYLITQLSGTCALTQDGNEAVLRPGDMALLDSGRPLRIRFQKSFNQLSVNLPRTVLETRLQHRRLPYAMAVSGRAGLGAVASYFFRSTFLQALQMSNDESSAMLDPILDLAASLLDRTVLVGESPAAPGTRTAQIAYIKRFIDSSLTDPDLTPARIAASLKMSTRHLHRLFEAESVTVGAWIRERRLEKCHAELADPRFAQFSITQIAFRWGFNDAAHFSRVFRARYGISPRDHRRQALHQKSPVTRPSPPNGPATGRPPFLI